MYFILRSPAAQSASSLPPDSHERLFEKQLNEDTDQLKATLAAHNMAQGLFSAEVPYELFYDDELEPRIGAMANLRPVSRSRGISNMSTHKHDSWLKCFVGQHVRVQHRGGLPTAWVEER